MIDLGPLGGRAALYVLPVDHIWAMTETFYWQVAPRLESLSLRDLAEIRMLSEQAIEARAKERVNADGSPVKPYDMAGNGKVAKIDIVGPIMKRESSASFLFGGTSTLTTQDALYAAAKDPDVESILLHIESPGGQVSGTSDLADTVAEVDKVKPVNAYIADQGASAAYWIASQARSIATNKTGALGSIGAFVVLQDRSAQAAQQGVKVYVVKDGEFKGIGVPGTEITPEQLAEVRREVSAVTAQFVRAVARGRNMSAEDVMQVADGRMHMGRAAVRKKLADIVMPLPKAIAKAASDGVFTPQRGGDKVALTLDVVRSWLRGDTDVVATDEEAPNAPAPTPAPTPQPTPKPEETEPIEEEEKEEEEEECEPEARRRLAVAGIKTTADMDKLLAQAALGRDFESKLRAQVKDLAVLAFGRQEGEQISASVDAMPVDILRATGRQFEALAQAKGLLAKDPSKPMTRQTASSFQDRVPHTERVAVDADNAQAGLEDRVNHTAGQLAGTGLYQPF